MEEIKVKSPLRNETYILKPILRKGDWPYVSNPKSAGLVLWPGCNHNLRGVPYDPDQRRFVEPLTPEERAYFESEEAGLGYKTGELSSNRRGALISPKLNEESKNYWTNYSLVLTDAELKMRLSDPMDYIRWAYVKCQSIVAENKESAIPKTHLYYLELEGVKEKERASKADLLTKAFSYFSKLQEDPTKLKRFYKIYEYEKNGKLPELDGFTIDTVKARVSDIIQDFTERFINLVEDSDLDRKLEIVTYLEEGIIKYLHNGNKRVFRAIDKSFDNIKEIIDYINNPLNQDFYLELIATKDKK